MHFISPPNRSAVLSKTKLIALVALLFLGSLPLTAQVLRSNARKPPKDYDGPQFELSYLYPVTVPKDTAPWLQYDFHTEPEAYMRAVVDYCLEGNLTEDPESDFQVQNNPVRKWYHAPNLTRGSSGREFKHGLTRERRSMPKELHPNQSEYVENWGIGFYNGIGAFTIGEVYDRLDRPDPKKALFKPNTVSFKLLFTAASEEEVPYLKGAYKWIAHVGRSKSKRRLRALRLIQFDIAVKDARSRETGWVFGTLVYHADAPGETVWDKFIPVGIQWGNDPEASTPEEFKECWINPDYADKWFRFDDSTTIHLGYKGRLVGPVDNPNSSCLSCHATAQTPAFSMNSRTIRNELRNEDKFLKKFFSNTYSGDLFFPDPFPDEPTYSLDYSLQLAKGFKDRYKLKNRKKLLPYDQAYKKYRRAEKRRIELDQILAMIGDQPGPPANPISPGHPAMPSTPAFPHPVWILLVLGLLGILSVIPKWKANKKLINRRL